MDTQAIAICWLDAQGWTYRIDPASGQIDTWCRNLSDMATRSGRDAALALRLQATPCPTWLELRARRLAGAGGYAGRFELPLASLVATLAYDGHIVFGVDPQSGEVMASRRVDFTSVRPEARPTTLEHACEAFLNRCVRVVQLLNIFRQHAGRMAGTDISALYGHTETPVA